MPLDSTIEKDWENEMKDAREYTRKLNVISTKDKESEESETEKESIQEKVTILFSTILIMHSVTDCNIFEFSIC